MSALYFLSVDLGATSGRVMLGRFDGNRVALESLHRFATPLVRIGDRYYWNIYSLYEELLTGFAIAGSRQLPIVSIGIDTWGVDMAFVGRDGALAGLPRSYRDPYTHGVPEEFFAERMPRREVYDRTGIQMLAFNSLFQLFALQKEGCSALETAQRLLFMPDALAYLLTGEMVTEYTIFSTSQCMNALSRQPDAALLQAVGVSPSLFSRAVMPGERVGLLTRSIGQATGLGQIPVVAVAGHDTASAVAAVPARDAHFAYLSSGTWSLLGTELEHPVIDDESYALNFTNEGGVDGSIRFLKNITGMWLLEQCREAWAKEGKEYSYPEIMRMTEAAAPSGATIDPDAAEFAAPTDMPKAIRAYCREHGIPEPADDAALMRSIFDSLAARYAAVLRELQKACGFTVSALHVIGGGAQNELLNRLTAEACGIPVIAGPAEATALGNVLVQARAAGLVGSLSQMRQCVAESVETRIFES